MQYHPKADSEFTSLPTFVAEFKNCSVNSLPVLVTEDRHLVTEHLWPMLDKYKHKPKKHHDLWDSWGENIDIRMPPITKQFHDTYKYVWLPIDKDSTNNPWHIAASNALTGEGLDEGINWLGSQMARRNATRK